MLFNGFSIIFLYFTFWLTFTSAQYDDVRCKCVCPSILINNSTSSNKIFVKSFHEPSRCKCEYVVDKLVQDSQLHFCERCDCQWQRRNTTTIKIVVIFIICSVSMLLLYMLFLLCLDPLLAKRSVPYVAQLNDETSANDRDLSRPVSQGGSANYGQLDGDFSGFGISEVNGGVISRVRNKVCNVKSEQEKWKDTVQEQRRNIYDKHTMLN